MHSEGQRWIMCRDLGVCGNRWHTYPDDWWKRILTEKPDKFWSHFCDNLTPTQGGLKKQQRVHTATVKLILTNKEEPAW